MLVVEDEASIASFVSLYLKNAGYDVEAVSTGGAALTQVAAESPALIILDLMLPDLDGIEVCRRMRKTSDVPILMLTARDEDVDKIIGLEVGADDYLTKPFNPRELVARVKSILRRAAPERRRAESEGAPARRSRDRRRPARGEGREEEIQLAPKEFDLLWELLDHRGLVLTRDQLLERVWGYTFAGDTRTVDVHVRQLRRKLGDASPIVTVWGVGYKVGPGTGRRAPSLGVGAHVQSLRFRLPALFLGGDRARRARRDADRRSAASRATRTTSPSPSCGARPGPRQLYAESARQTLRGRSGACLRRVEARGRERQPALLRRAGSLSGRGRRLDARSASGTSASTSAPARSATSSSRRPARTVRFSRRRTRSGPEGRTRPRSGRSSSRRRTPTCVTSG